MSDKGLRILVADDEPSLRGLLIQLLSGEGHELTEVESGEQALEAFRKEAFPLIITDIRMGGMSGLDLLNEIKIIDPDTLVIIVTSYASLDTAIKALRDGAYDYVMRPFDDLEIISAVVKRATEKIRLISENKKLVQKLERNNSELERVNVALKELAIRDGLTGLFNHRHFQETLSIELSRSIRHERNFSLLFLDIDLFKQYNDVHGHPKGDELLSMFGKLVKERLRKADFVARYGGEEFVIMLPETPKAGALRVADDIRKHISDYPFKGRETQPLGRVTVSIGVATFPEDGKDGSELIKYADKVLYKAKQSGRNTVC